MPRLPLVMLTLLVLATPARAQPDAAPSPAITADGVLGIGHLYTSRIGGLYGIETSANIRYRRHALGFRVRAFQPLIFGRTQLWEIGSVYSFTVIGGLSVGAGVSYVSEVYVPESTYNPVLETRIGIPLEVTYLFREAELVGPFVRAFANFDGAVSFGGISFGITL